MLRELGQIGSNLQLNWGKLAFKGLILLLKSAFSVNAGDSGALHVEKAFPATFW